MLCLLNHKVVTSSFEALSWGKVSWMPSYALFTLKRNLVRIICSLEVFESVGYLPHTYVLPYFLVLRAFCNFLILAHVCQNFQQI